MSDGRNPFTLRVTDEAISDLAQRLARTRLPDQAPGTGWTTGTELAWMEDLLAYWRDKFDWRAEEARLNALPQFTVPIDGIDLHFLHVPGNGPAPLPLLLLHGWPGSVFEFLELIPRLTDPARFGSDPADALTVIAPSLPGFGLSFAPGQRRFDGKAMADCLTALMTDVLGYQRFAIQGGDWGCFIGSRIACDRPDLVVGLHLNLLPLRRDPGFAPADPTPEEEVYRDQLAAFLKEDTGYQWI